MTSSLSLFTIFLTLLFVVSCASPEDENALALRCVKAIATINQIAPSKEGTTTENALSRIADKQLVQNGMNKDEAAYNVIKASEGGLSAGMMAIENADRDIRKDVFAGAHKRLQDCAVMFQW